MAKTVSKKKMSAVRGGATVSSGVAVKVSAADRAVISKLPAAAQNKFNGLNVEQRAVFLEEVKQQMDLQEKLKLSNKAYSTVMCPW